MRSTRSRTARAWFSTLRRYPVVIVMTLRIVLAAGAMIAKSAFNLVEEEAEGLLVKFNNTHPLNLTQVGHGFLRRWHDTGVGGDVVRVVGPGPGAGERP